MGMTVAASAAAWLGTYLQAARHEDRVLREQFGESRPRAVRSWGRIYFLNFWDSPKKPTADELRHLAEFRRLTGLALNRTDITDAGLVHVGRLRNLRVLFLDRTPITDAGLSHLRGLNRLVFLSLDGTKITDKGLAHIENLTELRDLNLSHTNLTDEGLKHLARLENLDILTLPWNYSMTLSPLSHCTDGGGASGQITDQGIQRLRQALPHTTVGGP